MTRRRQRNNGQNDLVKQRRSGQTRKIITGGKFMFAPNVNSAIDAFVKQYFTSIDKNEKFDLKTNVGKIVVEVKKNNSSVTLKNINLEELKKEINDSFEKNYLANQQTMVTIPNYLNAVKSYNERRKNEISSTYSSNFVNASLSVIGFTSMVSVTNAIVTAGPNPTLEQIGIIKDSATNVGNVVKVVAIGLGATLSAAISSTGLGFLVLFTLLSTISYFSNLYLKQKELQEISKLITNICEYIKGDAQQILFFYNTTQSEKKNKKINALFGMLYNLILKTMFYFPQEYFTTTFKQFMENGISIKDQYEQIKAVYEKINLDSVYEQCASSTNNLIYVGNILVYKYIIYRLHAIKNQTGWVSSDFDKGIASDVNGNSFKFKTIVEQKIYKRSETSFLNSGEQLRQLLGDYAIMDTTYTMTVTDYIFDYQRYVLKSQLESINVDILEKLCLPIQDINDAFDAILKALDTNKSDDKFYDLLIRNLYANMIQESKKKLIEDFSSTYTTSIELVDTTDLSLMKPYNTVDNTDNTVYNTDINITGSSTAPVTPNNP
jgi:hypothetical protein